MKRNIKKSVSGFTLLEVVITIGIFSIVFGYFMVYYTHEIRQYYSKENQLELKQDVRIALDRVVTKIRSYSGLSINTRADGTISTIKDEAGDVIINTTPNESIGEIYYVYDSSKGFGQLNDSSDHRIVGNIKEFTITQDASSSQLLIIAIKCGNKKSDDVKSFTTAVRLH